MGAPAERFSSFPPFAPRPLEADRWRRYGVAVAAVFVAACLRLILVSLLHQQYFYVTFFLALFVSAWYGGLGPGLLTLVLSLATVYFSLPAAERTLEFTGSTVNTAGVLFALTGLATSWLGGMRLRAFRRSEEHALEAAAEARRAEEEQLLEPKTRQSRPKRRQPRRSRPRRRRPKRSRGSFDQAAVRRSEQELSDFFENASVGIHWLKEDGTIVRANRAGLDTLGYESSDFLGKKIDECHADPDVAREVMRRVSGGEELSDYPARFRCRDGSVRDMLISGSAYRENGRFVHARCFVRDVTEQKRAEEAVRSLQRLESVGQLAGGWPTR